MISVNLERAIVFAACAHDNQKRKGDFLPYIIHPYTVAMILYEQGCGDDVVIAGLLHDTVEDTDTTLTEIENEFGKHVAEIVHGCTEADKSAPWEERKKSMIQIIRNSSHEVKWVTCADKLHNLRTLVNNYEQHGEKIWSRFSRGFKEQKWYATSLLESLFYGLEPQYQKPMFHELKTLIESFYGQA